MVEKRKIQGLLLISVGVVTWALLPIALKPAATMVEPHLLVFARFLIACLLLLPYVLVLFRGQPMGTWHALWASRWLLVLLMLLGFVIPQVCFTWALGREFVGFVVFIVYSYPFFSVLFARLLLGERLRRRFLGVSVVLLIGLFLVFGSSAGESAIDGSRLLSVAAALAVAICWGASTVISKRLLNRNLPSTIVAYTKISVGVLAMLPYFVVSGGFDPQVWHGLTLTAWLGLLFAAVVPVAIGLPLYMAGLTRVAVVEASIVEAWVPVLAAVLAIPWLGENLAAMQWVGGGLVVVASIMAGSSGVQAAPTVLPEVREAQSS